MSGRHVTWLGLALAAAMHAGALAGVSAATRPESNDARLARIAQQRSDVLAAAESGRMPLGEAFIRLGFLDRPDLAAADRDIALTEYRSMLRAVRDEVMRGTSLSEAVADAVARDGRAARYKRMYPWLAEALVHGGGNCVALSTLAASLAHDAIEGDRGDRVGFRIFANHVVPEVDGFHFGMASKCHGKGESIRTRDLIGAYRRAQEAGAHEPFSLPRAVDACDDPGDVFGNCNWQGATRRPRHRTSMRNASDGTCSRNTKKTSR